MKKLAIILLSASMISSSAFAADNVLATFKGGEVLESQIMQEFKIDLDKSPETKGKKFSELDKNIQEGLVRGFINTKLLDQASKDLKIEDTKEYKEKISEANTLLDKQKQELPKLLARQEVINLQLKEAATDKAIDVAYDKLVADSKGKEDIKVSHILVDNEETAKDIKKKLSKGGNFAALAKEFSKDEGSKSTGGELRMGDADGYIRSGTVLPEFESKALSLKVKEISDPIQTKYGWHVIKLLGRRPIKVPTKEEAKQYLSNSLSQEAVSKYITELNSKAEVKLTLPAALVAEPKKESK